MASSSMNAITSPDARAMPTLRERDRCISGQEPTWIVRRPFLAIFLLLLGTALPCHANEKRAVVAVTVDPPAVRLSGPNAVYSLLVHGKTADGRLLDLTHDARFRSAKPDTAAVTPAGVVQGKADGATEVLVEVKGRTLRVPVRVEGAASPRAFHFENDIVPL